MKLMLYMPTICIVMLSAAAGELFSSDSDKAPYAGARRANAPTVDAFIATNINLQNADLYYKFPVSTPEINAAKTHASAALHPAAAPNAQSPQHIILHQNYPNPFNERTFLKFEIDRRAFVDLTIFDASGQVVHTLLSTTLEAGLYLVPWDGRADRGRALISGVYYARLKSGDFSAVNRMVLLR